MTDAIGPGEAGRRLGVSTRTVQRWLREGRLPAVRVGGRLKVDASAFATPGASVETPPTPLPEIRPPSVDRRVRRLLVANRGELVARIARTCGGLGVACIGLVPPDQRGAWWTRQAHATVPLEGDYLDIAAVVAAAGRCGADAIHPGYGFLAERPDAAEAIVAAGLTWVGPPPAAMRAVGDKAAARRLAASLGIPTLAGYDGDDQSDAALTAAAKAIGFPLITKPSAGGGGKGMHVVGSADELPGAIAQARREARAAFGDERLVLERFITGARHVEIQVLVDRHGRAIHLGERDCSLQRRHQKLVEEAPSPAVDADLRDRLGEAALRLARAAGYEGAGTVEFLVDGDGHEAFLELNARLQVEHPVTELVTGRDLVADQLRIASGAPLGGVTGPRLDGHAIEARLYAEDPWADFLPATGRVLATRWPEGDGIRVDAGVGEGDEVETRYDPLLAKILAAGATRAEALERLVGAIERTSVVGVTTNREALLRLLALPAMQQGAATTDLVERAWSPPDAAIPAAAWSGAGAVLGGAAGGGRGGDGASPPVGFRLNAPARVRVAIEGESRRVDVKPGADRAVTWAMDGADVVLDADGRALRARLASPPDVHRAGHHAVEGVVADRVAAPMPGTVVAVHVAVGDAVEAGQVLVVLEAMKMEHAVAAPAAGVVTGVSVAAGDQVTRGRSLVELG